MVIALETHGWYDNYQTLHMVHKPIPIIWNHNFSKYYKFCEDLELFQSFIH
jgi:hypothetical protein